MDQKNSEFVKKVQSDDVKFIQLQFTDFYGAIKSVTIPVERLGEGLEKGHWFDGSSIEGFARIAESDMYLVPDISTYAILPWEAKQKREARLICDVYKPNGEPFEGDPRNILKRVVNEARDMGFEYNVGPELEFFLFKPTADGKIVADPHDVAGYFDCAPRDLANKVKRDIVFALEEMGLEVEMSHHEVAPGQHEIDFKYNKALRTADDASTFKVVVKSIANEHGLYATFMPKPIFGVNGNGMHVHQSLFDIKTRKNAFYDSNGDYNLSDVARHFIAGQLFFARGISAIVAPTVNSYKRLVPGYEAPVYICWAQINRSALIRIPKYSKGREEMTRAELRCGDPSCNPYLAFAAMLKAGLEGIKNKMKIPDPVEENVYELDKIERSEMKIDTLPASLGEAIDEMSRCEIIAELFGQEQFRRFINSKNKEWDEYRIQVTPWEVAQYLERT
ncbi:MAG: type I glutamate--ammonia ligase [Pseudomonadota bacterium]